MNATQWAAWIGITSGLLILLWIGYTVYKRMNEQRSSILVAAQEDQNLRRYLKLLGDTYNVVTAAEALYDTLPPLCQLPKDVENNEKAFAAGVYANLMFMCRRQLTIGTLTLLRGQRSDSKQYLRKAIETCAFGAKMDQHPHMARSWLSAGESEEAFDEYRKDFKKLFASNDPILKQLGKHYDECSKSSHPSIYGMALYFVSQPNESGTGLNVFDSMTDAVFVAEFMKSMSVHASILQMFERLLKPYTGDRLERWSKQRIELTCSR